MISDLGSLATIVYGAVNKDTYGHQVWMIGTICFFLFPFVNETLINTKARIFRSALHNHKCEKMRNTCFPIVYSPKYNITAFGLEKIHPFDSCKYQRVFESLRKKKVINDQTQIHSPSIPTREFLLEKMSAWYLFKLQYSIYICKCLEVPLFFLPSWFLRFRVLNPMLRATQGSVDASCIALQQGWAINLAGGYHHASCTCGGGFCIYPDITFIVHNVKKYHGINRVMIIDLDAHQGNGHERDFLRDPDVHIVDAYNPNIYPGDDFAETAIKTRIPITHYDDDESFLHKLKSQITEAYQQFRPEFVIYNAGTDCMENDPLGQLNISPAGIIQRDELMFEMAIEQFRVPIVMVLSGGYQMSNAPVIADSIENFIQRFKLKEDF
eukprot:403332831